MAVPPSQGARVPSGSQVRTVEGPLMQERGWKLLEWAWGGSPLFMPWPQGHGLPLPKPAEPGTHLSAQGSQARALPQPLSCC